MDYEITVEIEGKIYEGSYDYSENIITVFFEDESRTTQIDGASGNIESLARQMLRSIVVKKLK